MQLTSIDGICWVHILQLTIFITSITKQEFQPQYVRKSLSYLKGKAPPSHYYLDQLKVNKKFRETEKGVTNILFFFFQERIQLLTKQLMGKMNL